MPRTGRPKADLTLTEAEREQLLRWARRSKSTQALALRSKIVLACADGSNNQVAAQLGCSTATVGKWRRRFVENGWTDWSMSRAGRPPSVWDDGSNRSSSPRWRGHRAMPRTGPERRWRRIGRTVTVDDRTDLAEVRPQAASAETFKLSTDPLFVEKVVDVVGLYLQPACATRR